MPNAVYAKWLLHVTVPADDHKIVRVLDMTAPDDEAELLNEHVARLNPDMRVVSVERFDDPEKFADAVAAANAKNIKQPGYKPYGRYDVQMTAKQVAKVKKDRDEALGKARNRHQLPHTPEVPAGPATVVDPTTPADA